MAGSIKFIAIPETVLKNPDLSFTAKLLFGALRYRQYDKSCCWPKTDSLAQALGTSRAAISRAIGQLERAGLIKVKRKFKKSNIYNVVGIRDRIFLRVRLNVAAMPGMLAIDKLLTALLEYGSNNDDSHAFAYQTKMAAGLGCSRASIIRSLQRLEKRGKVNITHRGGGRKRGNYYVLTTAFFDSVLIHDSRKTVSKRYIKDNNSKVIKGTAIASRFSLGGLSSKASGQDEAYRLLRRHGVHTDVARSLVYIEGHPTDSIDAAVKNSISRKAWLKTRDPFRAGLFNVPGYIVASLNIARHESHTIKPSNRYLNLCGLRKKPYKPLNSIEFEKRRQEQLKRLLAG